jgi:hypothetical protein
MKAEYTVEQLTADSEVSFGILANLDTHDTEFVSLESIPLPADKQRAFTARGLAFIGCVGLVAGQPRAALDLPLSEGEVDFIVAAFQSYTRKHLRWTMRPNMDVN